MLRILTPFTLNLISRSDKVSPYLTWKMFSFFFNLKKTKKKQKRGRTFWQETFDVFNMPGAISGKNQADRVTSSWAHPLPLHSPHVLHSFFFWNLIFFHILLQIQLLRAWERLLFCFWKINSHYKQDRKKDESEKKETDSYPCPSDPAWRLSSALIALLISSPLSVDLGQQSSWAGAD